MKSNIKKVSIIASEANWIEGEAVRQLEKTAQLDGVVNVFGMPDIHPGKGYPIGAAFFIKDMIYPYILGNDLGCGMSVWMTDLKSGKLKKDRWEKKLKGIEKAWEGNLEDWLSQNQIPTTDWDHSMGTIGGGNHFAELQMVEKVENQTRFQEMGLDRKRLFLTVHSGSRGLGESILQSHIDSFKDNGVVADSPEGIEYLKKHNLAIEWASSNRSLIQHRFLSLLGTQGKLILDSAHNFVEKKEIEGDVVWIHRKGVVSSGSELVYISGTRGSYSYLVEPIGDQINNGFSLAHEAGRKWSRGDTKKRLSSRFKVNDLKQTKLGSKVICENKELLYEEAPQAYKNIDNVIQDMLDAGLIRVIAVLRPVITYKTRKNKT